MQGNAAPERLLSEHYFGLSSPYQIYKHQIDRTITTHWHDFFEMAFVVSGTGTHVVNGVPLRLGRGTAFLLTTADFHEIVPDEGVTIRLYNFIFREHLVKDGLLHRLLQDAANLMHTFEGEAAADMEREFARIWTEVHHPGRESEAVIQCCVQRLLIDLARHNDAERAGKPARLGGPLHASIEKALLYLQHHFREPVTLEQIANLSGLSANYFSEMFKKQTGTSYQNCLQELRLQFARSLLLSSDLPVTEVCFGSGFNTLPHFDRAFRLKYGCSPRQLRQANAAARSK
ncbi:AraC family transcriptional regulator [Paenibacillus arenilitoris]|uniref:Helix-turn-helix transcriptional regulator n=1 Tax=Paenibacillus arenilitoris TaxID=2772299 RepID=A0A927H6D3_9BACL|nr:AraC family transcriptional regulator [Paenibacillus arenilitoris]MBD2869387.1 helix-turn-helix transcriptional regulator [Paenibacillus arenilitoris]